METVSAIHTSSDVNANKKRVRIEDQVTVRLAPVPPVGSLLSQEHEDAVSRMVQQVRDDPRFANWQARCVFTTPDKLTDEQRDKQNKYYALVAKTQLEHSRKMWRAQYEQHQKRERDNARAEAAGIVPRNAGPKVSVVVGGAKA